MPEAVKLAPDSPAGAEREHGVEDHGGKRPLRGRERVDLALLAMPTFALALAITIVSTQLGEVVRHYTHQTVTIGLIVGGEGVMALWVPLIFGSWSDILQTRIGGRLPFLAAGAIPAAVALALIGLVHGLVLIAAVSAVFFFAYFVAYEPYRAMYPDMLPDEVGGRSQSAQAVARGLGTALALLSGGLLLSVNRALPFLLGAVVMVLALAAFIFLIVRRGVPQQRRTEGEGPLRTARQLLELVRAKPELRAYFFANALWEAALSALKAFIILYLVVGLGYQLGTSSLLIGGVALVILFGAGAAGVLGDRYGRLRVVRIAVIGYGIGYLVLVFTTNRILMAVTIPLIAFGGGTVMTMAYAMLMPMMPSGEHGALTGFYSISRGVGNISGPVLAGLLIWVTRTNLYASTQGFQAVWIVCACACAGSLWFLQRMAGSLKASGERVP